MSTKGPWTHLELQLKDQLETFQKHPDNQECADCTSKGPRWAVFNHGIFVCIKCSGQHRNLGREVSKVKSITMDRWLQDQYDQMIGNLLANQIMLCNAPSDVIKPQENDDRFRVKYITQKYERKAWRANPEQERLIRSGVKVQPIQQAPQQAPQQTPQQPQYSQQPNNNMQNNYNQYQSAPQQQIPVYQQPMQQQYQNNFQQPQQPVYQQPIYQQPQQPIQFAPQPPQKPITQQPQYKNIQPAQQPQQIPTQPQAELQLDPCPQVPQVEDLLSFFDVQPSRPQQQTQEVISVEPAEKQHFQVQIKKPLPTQPQKQKSLNVNANVNAGATKASAAVNTGKPAKNFYLDW